MNRYLYRFALVLLALLIALPNTLARDDRGRFIVVLDPGHGGKDSGAIGKKTLEKNIVLDVVLKTGKRIQELNPNIIVLYTRKTDVFIGLKDRTNFANRHKADLFVSIHANSHRTSSPNGAETFVLGLDRTDDNLEVAMKENSAILYEEDYSVTYQGFDPNNSESYIVFSFMQNRHLASSIEVAEIIQNGLVNCGLNNRGVKQDIFLVLREAAMPSVLVELGFISNRANEDYMRSARGSQELANSIAKGIVEYEAKLRKRSSLGQGNAPATASTPTPSSTQQSQVTVPKGNPAYYRIQVHADRKQLSSSHPAFKGYEKEVSFYREGNLYKYTLYNVTDLAEAKRLQRELRAKYKDCFIVGFNEQGDKVGSYY